eukprot:gene10971-12798_t
MDLVAVAEEVIGEVEVPMPLVAEIPRCSPQLLLPNIQHPVTIESFANVGTTIFVVPAGVTRITAYLYGASGGTVVDDISGTIRTGFGGMGGTVSANIPVVPGETLQLNIGGRGGAGGPSGAGFNGGGQGCALLSEPSGGGGGASDVRRTPFTLNQRLAVAGGGGGGYSHFAANGGAGGYPAGGIGSTGLIEAGVRDAPTGGTATAGGTTSNPSTAQCFHVGAFGEGASCCLNWGGGGGGGYWGGGHAHDTGGGGGGSSFIDVSSGVQLISHSIASMEADGSVTLVFA